jgi:hypothetical protein
MAPSAHLNAALTTRAYEIEAQHGTPTAQAFFDMATGKLTPLTAHVPQWLADGARHGAPLKDRTKAERRSAIEKLGAWMAKERLPVAIEAVTRKIAGRYVSEALLPSGRDPATVAKLVKHVGAYWSWLIRRGHLPDSATSPWVNQGPVRTAKQAGTPNTERPFTNAELALLLASPPSQTMADFIRVAALTGMRREEIGRLRVVDCQGGVFVVHEGKTAAAARRVPIHSKLAGMVERRNTGQPAAAYLFADSAACSLYVLPFLNGQRHSMSDHPNLRPATDEELIDSLSFALRFNGRKRRDVAGPFMARVAAEHLVRHLTLSGYVIMKGADAALPKVGDYAKR